jgi:hypothetical protein
MLMYGQVCKKGVEAVILRMRVELETESYMEMKVSVVVCRPQGKCITQHVL